MLVASLSLCNALNALEKIKLLTVNFASPHILQKLMLNLNLFQSDILKCEVFVNARYFSRLYLSIEKHPVFVTNKET